MMDLRSLFTCKGDVKQKTKNVFTLDLEEPAVVPSRSFP